jgi:ribonucleoside-diphosphate reductase alpha chain
MLDARETPEIAAESKSTPRRRPARCRSGRSKAGGAERSGGWTRGLRIEQLLTQAGVNPFDTVEWEKRHASITGDNGETLFEMDDAEVPKSWSMLATNVVASKYFYGSRKTDVREHSARELIHRVCRTIADWGLEDGIFASAEDAETFYTELCFVCLHQLGAFNSPVWFNVGLFQVCGLNSDSRTSYRWDEQEQKIVPVHNNYEHPQASACFIQAVEDSMEDIMRLASSEAMLFKYGSGTGTDLSTLRSCRERLSGGGTPSGPLSFMRVYDQVAAVIKSGGKTRRAAKMQSLKVTHPDILEFIEAKPREEKKAWALIEEGYDGSFGGEAYESVMFQNSNFSVRVTDEFMQAVENDGTWQTRAVLSGEPVETYKARDLMRRIAEGAHLCGDPGVQYDTTINRWHTCLESGRINASNPCSEFMFLDNSACNLASVNLMKFIDEAGTFDIKRFQHVTRLFIIAQDILVDNASYPSEDIAYNSHTFRPLGLGYANLGALIMRLGLPYDSDEGRALAGVVTALMTGSAYAASQDLARVRGPFAGYEANRACMHRVLKQHAEALKTIDSTLCPPDMRKAAERVWKDVVESAPRRPFRNAQVTLLAPTGTIGFMMDCDTTGVEPDIALIKYKQLAGGGTMKIVNRTLRPALKRLGYPHEAVESILKYVDAQETIEGSPDLNPEHLKVFDCAFKPRNGKRSIHYKAHLHMMAAVQPFLSGAISKTVNMPTDVTVNDVLQAYVDGWKLGLKAVAIYRDGSKRTQPLNTSDTERDAAGDGAVAAESRPVAARQPFRRRMPATRYSITHKFEVAGHEGYLTVGTYEDGSPGELFITMAKEGSTVGGIMDSFGTAISLCLQYGVPVRELCKKFAHSRFEPSGFTKNPDIPIAKSIVDYIFRWLDLTFPDGRCAGTQPVAAPAAEPSAPRTEAPAAPAPARAPVKGHNERRIDAQFKHFMDDAPACDLCGAITVRNGACYRCYNCGNSMGCS